MTIARQDLTRITLAVLSIGLLILGSLWILRPFLGAVIWATMVVVASWPMLRWLQARLWGRRWLATAMMTSALMLMFVVPLTLAIGTIVLEADRLIAWGKGLAALRLSPPPEFLQKIPFIGGKIAAAWEQALAAGAEGLTARLAPYANDIVRWFVSEVGGGVGVLKRVGDNGIWHGILPNSQTTTSRDSFTTSKRLPPRAKRGVSSIENRATPPADALADGRGFLAGSRRKT